MWEESKRKLQLIEDDMKQSAKAIMGSSSGESGGSMVDQLLKMQNAKEGGVEATSAANTVFKKAYEILDRLEGRGDLSRGEAALLGEAKNYIRAYNDARAVREAMVGVGQEEQQKQAPGKKGPSQKEVSSYVSKLMKKNPDMSNEEVYRKLQKKWPEMDLPRAAARKEPTKEPSKNWGPTRDKAVSQKAAPEKEEKRFPTSGAGSGGFIDAESFREGFARADEFAGDVADTVYSGAAKGWETLNKVGGAIMSPLVESQKGAIRDMSYGGK